MISSFHELKKNSEEKNHQKKNASGRFSHKGLKGLSEKETREPEKKGGTSTITRIVKQSCLR